MSGVTYLVLAILLTMTKKIAEILRSKEQVRKIANSFYVCVPRSLVRSRKLVPGDPVSVSVMSDGSVRMVFEKGDWT